jgi:hypothetical protein
MGSVKSTRLRHQISSGLAPMLHCLFHNTRLRNAQQKYMFMRAFSDTSAAATTLTSCVCTHAHVAQNYIQQLMDKFTISRLLLI